MPRKRMMKRNRTNDSGLTGGENSMEDSTTIKRERNRTRGGTWGALAMGLLLTVFLVGCDGLLDVDLPGAVEEEDLQGADMADILARGAQGDFECMFRNYVWITGLWADEFYSASVLRSHNVFGSRDRGVEQFGNATCASVDPPPLWQGLQTARFQAEDVVRRVQNFDQTPANADFLMGQSYAYGAYATQLLGEAFCEVTFDEGPAQSRADAFQRAEDQFTQAINLLQGVGGPEAARAQELTMMAYVGRARARLHLGDDAGVMSDAAQVDSDFVFYSTHSSSDTRRWNRVANRNNETGNISVHPKFRDLEVDGVPDPRVPVVWDGGASGPDGITDMWVQQKYPTTDSDIPMATGREALLMVAEVQGGQEAVDIINQLRATHDLPEYEGGTDAEIMEQVYEERQRELFLQGTHMGDKLRFDREWESGSNQKGEPFGPDTCLRIPEAERLNNPNLT
jgi:starch-binding outer membrane protein, SusD/RagB family